MSSRAKPSRSPSPSNPRCRNCSRTHSPRGRTQGISELGPSFFTTGQRLLPRCARQVNIRKYLASQGSAGKPRNLAGLAGSGRKHTVRKADAARARAKESPPSRMLASACLLPPAARRCACSGQCGLCFARSMLGRMPSVHAGHEASGWPSFTRPIFNICGVGVWLLSMSPGWCGSVGGACRTGILSAP